MEKEERAKRESELCPRCHKKFECRPDDIRSCHCAKIEISKEEYSFINSRFKTCLCNTCLNEPKNEYQMKSQSDRKTIFSNKNALVAFILLFALKQFAQPYAPPAGQAGTSAMYMDSSAFVNWAIACQVTRGYMDITNAAAGFASAGDNSMGTGKAQSNAIVSLGDGGNAVCTFPKPIANGAGYDFAVFENSFDDTFLELAFVEVSSDGQNFFRFNAHSLTDTTTQTAGFGPTNATKINNLAGKYRGGYGTPFDLQEFEGTDGLDISRITHVKIIDVVGNIDKSFASRDFYNNKINDPWPTPFPSGGFDLDAVGVIHESTITGIPEKEAGLAIRVFPNPVERGKDIKVDGSADTKIELIDLSGKCIYAGTGKVISTEGISPGFYCLRASTNTGTQVYKLLVQ